MVDEQRKTGEANLLDSSTKTFSSPLSMNCLVKSNDSVYFRGDEGGLAWSSLRV